MTVKHRGVALIMVLLAMTLMVMLAAGMVRQQNLWVFEAGHYQAQQQGISLALGAETFARQLLSRDFEDDQTQELMVDSAGESWAEGAAILPVDDNGTIEVQIDDLGGRINLNDLVTPAGEVDAVTRDRLKRLLQVLGITEVTVDALIDWVDADSRPVSAAGAEDGVYLMAEPGYRTANQPFASVSELRLIAGMTVEAYQRLVPHIIALPESGVGVNVNTATVPVLTALHDGMSASIVQAIVEERKNRRFESIDDFLAMPELAGMGLDDRGLRLNTRFFDVASRITYDNREVNMVSRVFRSAEGRVQTVHRDLSQKNRITKEPYTLSEG